MFDNDGPDRLARMIVSLHPALFWMFFVIGSSGTLPTNSHARIPALAPLVVGIDPMLIAVAARSN